MAKRRATLDDGPATHDAEAERLKAEIARLEHDLANVRESEAMYRSSAELSGRLVWRADPDGRLTQMSSAFEEIAGLPPARAMGDGWLDIVPEAERESVRRKWHESVRSGRKFAAEFPVRIADGSMSRALSEAVPRHDEAGRITDWFGTTVDISEQKRTEEARREAEQRLRESEEMHRYTLELSQQIAWTVEKDGSGLVMSARYEELTGFADNEQAEESVHSEDRALVQKRFAHSIETGTPLNVECRLRMKDGSYRRFRVRATPLRGRDGEILRWYGITEDIHDYREADVARREVEERFRLAGQATRDAIWDHDFLSGTIEWSENAAAVFGVTNALLGCTPEGWWRERLHPEDRPIVLQSLQAAIDGDAKRWTGTYRFCKDDGTYADMVDRGFIIRDDAGRAIRAVGAITDVTEQHRAEAEVRRMQGELVHVSRLSAMGAMASTLAHELNQPLTALANYISGAKRIVERREIADPQLADALISAEIGALRAGEIVRRLRELVSRGTVSVKAEHLPQLIEDASVLAFLDEEARLVSHRLALDPAAQYVRADRVQIQQVLINLIRNAVEALEDCETREIIVSTKAVPGEMVAICVEDTGPGVDPADLDNLFSEFMTTKSGGMGIGLPISRTIVEAHGGKIWVGNRPEGGAMFRFTLPRAEGKGTRSRVQIHDRQRP